MQIWQTANAGVLLSLDGTNILLDGVCKQVFPYQETPGSIRQELTKKLPDAVIYTHRHEDHFDESFVQVYKNAGVGAIIGPDDPLSTKVGTLNIIPVTTRHIGKSDVQHASFIIEGSKCVWFLGDAAPSEFRNRRELSIPDILIVPFAYATTESAWRITKSIGAKHIILFHMPERQYDNFGIWNSVEEVIKFDGHTYISEIGKRYTF